MGCSGPPLSLAVAYAYSVHPLLRPRANREVFTAAITMESPYISKLLGRLRTFRFTMESPYISIYYGIPVHLNLLWIPQTFLLAPRI